jgi:segregation and condensation protein B
LILVKTERVVEAALFSAGRPVSVEELADATGLEAELIRTSLRKLIRSSKNRDTALEVARAGSKYAMQLKAEFVPAAAKLAQMDIPRRLLKTLALIAYHQPIKQSDLLNMVGPKIYDHVKDLHKLGLILESPQGQTKILSTSSRFPEYFGIKTTKRDDIKKWLAEKMGIKVDGQDSGVKPAAEILATQQTLDAGAAGAADGAGGATTGKGNVGAKAGESEGGADTGKQAGDKEEEVSREPIKPPSGQEVAGSKLPPKKHEDEEE